jgi:hypothetical protein
MDLRARESASLSSRPTEATASTLSALTLLVSASLLFTVQPMIVKLLLPRRGGTPAVWNTCMLFFPACLLGGYAYAHVVARRLRLRSGA